jgi:hypothetical protein
MMDHTVRVLIEMTQLRLELHALLTNFVSTITRSKCYVFFVATSRLFSEGKMQPHNLPAPEVVELVYRVVGNTHVFSSRGIQGLVHIGSHDRKTAYENVVTGLNKHVAETCGADVSYKCEYSYEEFAQHVDNERGLVGNFLTMKLDHLALT